MASFTASTGTWTVTEYSAFSAGAINTSGEDICNGEIQQLLRHLQRQAEEMEV